MKINILKKKVKEMNSKQEKIHIINRIIEVNKFLYYLDL